MFRCEECDLIFIEEKEVVKIINDIKEFYCPNCNEKIEKLELIVD